MPRPNREPLLPVPEVATRLGVSEAMVWRLLRHGVLARIKVGHATRARGGRRRLHRQSTSSLRYSQPQARRVTADCCL